MTRNIIILLIVPIIVLTGCTEKDVSTPQKLAEAMIEAINSNDYEAYKSLIHPEVLLYFSEKKPEILDEKIKRELKKSIPEKYEIIVTDISDNEYYTKNYDPKTQRFVVGTNPKTNETVYGYIIIPPDKIISIMIEREDGAKIFPTSHTVVLKDNKWYITFGDDSINK